MKEYSKLKIFKNILFGLSGFVIFKTVYNGNLIMLETKIAIAITLIPALLIEIFIYHNKKE